MNVIVLNCGSSTIKCALYQNSFVWEALIEWKNGFADAALTIKKQDKTKHKESLKQTNPIAALDYLLSLVHLEKPNAVGHRVVHGGHLFKASVRITSEVKKAIREFSKLAPLHNLFQLEAIEFMERRFPNALQVAVFDTAFHHTIPEAARIYPGPYQWVESGICRYGFHGISFQYSAKKAAEMTQSIAKMVICHLGSGASLAAVKDGKSIDTTMGFTPLDGLMMGTRSGSIDPGIILYLLERKKKTPGEISEELYYHSGLLGLSGISSDMRDLLEKQEVARAKLALDVYLHRLNALIGSMIASLQGIDALVFTAGIGENASLLRKRVCENFSFLGVKLDPTQNERRHEKDAILSSNDSKVKILLIHTEEALEIAKECLKLL